MAYTMVQIAMVASVNAADIVRESGIGRMIIHWRFQLSNKKKSKSLPEKIASLEDAVQFLMDQDAKKSREIDKLKERIRAP